MYRKKNYMDREKVICRCHGVTYGQLEDVVNLGYSTYQEVFSVLKFGVGCGGCRSKIKQMIYFMAHDRDRKLKEAAEVQQ